MRRILLNVLPGLIFVLLFHELNAQPVQINFQEARIVNSSSAKQDWEYSVSINDYSLTEHSWMVLPDNHLKFVIQVQRKRPPSAFGMVVKIMDIKHLQRSVTNVIIPVIAKQAEDSVQWNFIFRINK
jgi:hypothetical protein